MKKIVIAVVIIISVLLIDGIVNKFTPPPVLDEEHINNDILMSDSAPVDKILLTREMDEYIACLCSDANKELVLLFVENNQDYSLSSKDTFTLNTLLEEPQKAKVFEPYFSDIQIKYNIYLNPQTDKIQIDKKTQDVYVVNCDFEGTKYTLGFWSFESKK